MKTIADKFKFVFTDTFLGYNSATDKSKLKPGFMTLGSKNVYKKISGTIASRPGIKRRGSIDTTQAPTRSSFEWSTSKGTFRALRVANGKLEVESDIVTTGTYIWYELKDTSTLASLAAIYTRFVFDTWWDNEQVADRLLMVRGDTSIRSWSGGMAVVESATATTIKKKGTSTWKESGFIPQTGVVTAVTINTGGSSYTFGDILTVTGGGGSGLTVKAVGITFPGIINTIQILTPGTGYTATTGLSVTGGTGTGFLLNITAATLVTNENRIIIDDREFTYTGGEDTTTLTGVTTSSGLVSTLTDGMVAIQSVIPYENIPVTGYKVDYIKTIGNQVWVGSYSSRLVYISADVIVGSTLGFANFVNSGGLVVGDPDAIILDSLGKGIGVRAGKVFLFSGDSDLLVVTPNFDLPISQAAVPITGGTARNVIQKPEKKQLPALTSALGHEFIGNQGEHLVWLDQKNRLRAIGSFDSFEAIKPANLSLPVQKEIAGDDFTGGHIRVISDSDGDTIYITAPNTGRDWMYQIREILSESGQVISERLWQPPQIRGIQRFAVIDGEVHGHSNVNPQVYQIWETGQWFDDNPDQEEIPYVCVARFPYRSFGRPEGFSIFDMVFVEGYMLQGVDLRVKVYFDYQGAKGTRELSVSNDTDLAQFFTGTNPSSLGDASEGVNPLGDGIILEADDQEYVPKFRSIPNVPQPKNFYESALEFYSLEVDARWELSRIGVNARVAKQVPTKLRK